MNIVLLYTRILKKFDERHPEHKSYAESSRRFLETYQRFKPAIPHRIVIVNCGQSEHDGMFDGVASEYANYNGGGYDCGTWQAIGGAMEADLVVGLNTHTYFWRPDWLEPFLRARNKFGPGVFGAAASYEQHSHLRTPCIAFSPEIMREYPMLVDSREKASWFEAGSNNFSIWVIRQWKPAVLVAADGFYSEPDWRKPPNIFRRGDQSNCLVFDRHCDIYRQAPPAMKSLLARSADGRARG